MGSLGWSSWSISTSLPGRLWLFSLLQGESLTFFSGPGNAGKGGVVFCPPGCGLQSCLSELPMLTCGDLGSYSSITHSTSRWRGRPHGACNINLLNCNYSLWPVIGDPVHPGIWVFPELGWCLGLGTGPSFSLLSSCLINSRVNVQLFSNGKARCLTTSETFDGCETLGRAAYCLSKETKNCIFFSPCCHKT